MHPAEIGRSASDGWLARSSANCAAKDFRTARLLRGRQFAPDVRQWTSSVQEIMYFS